MRAMILKEAGQLVIENREMPVCGDHDVLIQVKACGISEADYKLIREGSQDLLYPQILGHEIAGVIAEKGKNINVYKVGQKVFIHPRIGCGQCDHCRKGCDHLCDNVQGLGINRDGGFQDYLLFSEKEICQRMVNVVNHPQLTYDEISLIHPLACCVNIQDLLNIKRNEAIVIIGGGRMGLLNYLLAKSSKINAVYLIEKNQESFKKIKELGLDNVFEDEDQALGHLQAIDKRQGFDVVIPRKNHVDFMDIAVKLIKKKGRIGFFDTIQAIDGVGDSVINDKEWDFLSLYKKEIQMFTTISCGQIHTRKARSLLEAEKLKVDRLITRQVSLEHFINDYNDIEQSTSLATILQL